MNNESIKLLDEHLINQIKAGEVIERPANVLKELLENAIDSDPGKIDVEIRDSGLSLIKVEDDGHGIDWKELPIAFYRHTTSKLGKFEDLFTLDSFGFRGEALASISSISKITCRSKKSDQKGGKIEINGAQITSHIEAEISKPGTSIFIKDLFFNTPARLKFVKSKNSEKNALLKFFYGHILSYPNISFTLKMDDDEKLRYPTSSAQKRAEIVFFKKAHKESQVAEIDFEYEGYKVNGFIASNSSKSTSGKYQYIIANSRIIQDRALHMHIVRTLEPLWGFGSSGSYYLKLSVPTSHIDVNDHPDKSRVKFEKPSLIYSLIHGSIQKLLNQVRKSKIANNSNQLEEMSLPASDQYIGDLKPNRWSGFAHTSEQDICNGLEHFHQLTKKFSFYYKNDYSTLVHTPTMISNYLKTIYKEHSLPISEGGQTPLIISEPIKLEKDVDHLLEQINYFGFEVDRLDSTTLVLRGVPTGLEDLENHQVLRNILLCETKNGSSLNLDVFLKLYSNYLCETNIPSVFWEKLGRSDAELEGATLEISDQQLEKFFKGHLNQQESARP